MKNNDPFLGQDSFDRGRGHSGSGGCGGCGHSDGGRFQCQITSALRHTHYDEKEDDKLVSNEVAWTTQIEEITNKTNFVQDDNKKQKCVGLSFGKGGLHQPIKQSDNKGSGLEISKSQISKTYKYQYKYK